MSLIDAPACHSGPMSTALVIGGTGPTGPLVVNGLRDRGHIVTILHTGRHETDLIGPEVEHLHTDPFDARATEIALGDRTFDLAVVMYGRLRDLAALLVGRCGRFVSVGGVGVYLGFANPDELVPAGLMVPHPHGAALVGDGESFTKLRRIRETEEAVMDHHPDAIHLRYPQLYGPRQILPREWPYVRRALDRRPFMVVPDGGLTIKSQAWVANAAHATLLACDGPDQALGGIYNVADEQALSIAQIAEIVADELGHRWDIVGIPADLAPCTRPLLTSWSSSHRVLDIEPTRRDLGYRDVMAAPDAWRAATRWLAEHPLEAGGPTERRLQDPFDYEAEDRLVEAWAGATAAIEALPWPVQPGYSAAYVGSRPNPWNGAL